MAEGFFDPEVKAVPNLSTAILTGAMVRIRPRTVLVLGIVDSAPAVKLLDRNEISDDGAELWYRHFTRDDLNRVEEPEFAMGMVRHEFASAVLAGVAFPCKVALAGGGSGFSISENGAVLTNYHLVTSEIANFRRQDGSYRAPVVCRTLNAETYSLRNSSWTPARKVQLISNPPESDAIRTSDNGSQLWDDFALLEVFPAPSAALELATRPPVLGEPVWMAGFPLRSARSAYRRQALNYTDADGSLRVSTGVVTDICDDWFEVDCDGSMGNSGSAVFDEAGRVLGMFSRAVGNGPKNAFEYGHMTRACISMEMVEARLLRR